MKTLQQLAQGNSTWSLEELVPMVNALLPQYLPEERSHTRVREEVTGRLVRHYTTLGILDEPLKEGRYAVYTYRHLLQILVVRRLLAEGYGASAIDNFAKSKDNTELEALLQGGVQLTLTTANPALAFLEQIQNRQSIPKITPIPTSSTSAIVKPSASSRWARLEVIPGLEIHLREDFVYPSSPQEQQNLLQQIRQILIAFVTKGRSSK